MLGSVATLIAERDRVVGSVDRHGLPGRPQRRELRAVRRVRRRARGLAALLDAGVLVRDVGIPGWLRVTAGTAEENDAFLAALARDRSDSRSTR